jgi:hypothetical protein
LSETEIHKGSCLCGSVRFTTRGPLRGVIYCHCTQCRKQSGHYYAATNVPDGSIVIEGGEGISWYRSSPDAQRGFCRTCGSALFWKRDGSDYTSVLAGSFDQPSGLRGASHIFTADMGDYYAIADGLPKNEAWSS